MTELRDDNDSIPAVRERPRPTETTQQPPSETMSRQEYADHMRQGPAADTGDHGNQETGQQSQTDSEWQHQGEHAQGMTREEYADHMRQESAAGKPEGEGDSQGVRPTDSDSHESADRARWAAMYQEYLDYTRTPPSERGTNVVGDKPDHSPADIPGRPPTGAELLEPDDKDKSSAERFGRKLFREYGDFVDSAKDEANTVQHLLEHPPSSVEQSTTAMPTGPRIGPESVQYGTPDAGTFAETGLALGVVLFQTGRWVKHKMNEHRGDTDDRHRRAGSDAPRPASGAA